MSLTYFYIEQEVKLGFPHWLSEKLGGKWYGWVKSVPFKLVSPDLWS